jgi:hypothetical protein
MWDGNGTFKAIETTFREDPIPEISYYELDNYSTSFTKWEALD